MTDAAQALPAPMSLHAGVTPRWHRYRVSDAETGEVLSNVLEVDSAAGTVRRLATESGALVREGDGFKVLDEVRAVRIEDMDAPVPAPAPSPAEPVTPALLPAPVASIADSVIVAPKVG